MYERDDMGQIFRWRRGWGVGALAVEGWESHLREFACSARAQQGGGCG